MLLEFRVSNFRSFSEEVVFSMVAGPYNELPDNTFTVGKFTLLKTAAIYGANASGKTNLIKAWSFFREFVKESHKEMDTPNRQPFAYNSEPSTIPTTMEATLRIDGVRYCYGFSLDDEGVLEEHLFSYPVGVKRTLIKRDRNTQIKTWINQIEFKEGRGIESKVRDKALFLSVTAQFNGAIATNVIKGILNAITLYPSASITSLSLSVFKPERIDHEKTREFLKLADSGIDNFKYDKIVVNDEQKSSRSMSFRVRGKADGSTELTQETVSTYHKNNNDESVIFSMDDNESRGTQRIFVLSSPIIDALKEGSVLFIDEIESSLHPLLAQTLVQMFNSPVTNPNNAQLIFTTHDTNLLNPELMRRDQIWFTEKSEHNSTDLYSLLEFKGVRKEAFSDKKYLGGKYGGIPFLSIHTLDKFTSSKVSE